MLKGVTIQGSCVKCHDNFESLKGAEVAAQGRKLFNKHGCQGCHAINGWGGVVSVGSFQARALSAAACRESRSDLGLTTIVFGLGALIVVGTYGLMVRRWWRGRGTA